MMDTDYYGYKITTPIILCTELLGQYKKREDDGKWSPSIFQARS